MSRIFDSLAVRIAAVFLVGLIALQLAIGLIIAWPDGPAGFPLISPKKAAAMARAIEAAPATLQPLIVDALNSNGLIVQLLPDFPGDDAADGPIRDAPRRARLFVQSGADLEERAFRVQIHGGAVVHSLSGERVGVEGPVRLLVRLRTGQALVVERAPVLLQRVSSRFLAIATASAGILLAVLLACMRHIARPIHALAAGARRLPQEIAAPDLPLRGPRELKELAAALKRNERYRRRRLEPLPCADFGRMRSLRRRSAISRPLRNRRRRRLRSRARLAQPTSARSVRT